MVRRHLSDALVSNVIKDLIKDWKSVALQKPTMYTSEHVSILIDVLRRTQ